MDLGAAYQQKKTACDSEGMVEFRLNLDYPAAKVFGELSTVDAESIHFNAPWCKPCSDIALYVLSILAG